MTPEQQVLAAVRAYYAAANTAAATGDVRPLEAASLPQCDCRKLARSIASTYAAKQRLVNAVDTLTNVKVINVAPPAASVSATINVAAYSVVSANGATKSYPADSFSVGIALIQQKGQWLVAAVRGAS